MEKVKFIEFIGPPACGKSYVKNELIKKINLKQMKDYSQDLVNELKKKSRFNMMFYNYKKNFVLTNLINLYSIISLLISMDKENIGRGMHIHRILYQIENVKDKIIFEQGFYQYLTMIHLNFGFLKKIIIKEFEKKYTGLIIKVDSDIKIIKERGKSKKNRRDIEIKQIKLEKKRFSETYKFIKTEKILIQNVNKDKNRLKENVLTLKNKIEKL